MKTFSLEEQIFTNIDENSLKNVCESVIQLLERYNYHYIVLLGEMGSGKTTLIRYLLQYFTTDVFKGSPTFNLCYQYELDKLNFFPKKSILHLDFDRIVSSKELTETGLEDFFREDNLLLIENEKKLINRSLMVSWLEITCSYVDNSDFRTIALNPKTIKKISL